VKIETLDGRTARRIALAAASGFPPAYSRDLEGAAQFVSRSGYIQIDTISVVARAHEHALWSRVGALEGDPLKALQGAALQGAAGGERRIFEYWAHAAAYLPVAEFRYCLPRMERVRRDGHDWFSSDGVVVASVLERIRNEGPLSSADFEDPRGGGAGWWDWKPAKRALEYLFQAGELLVTTRKGFVKVFDLAERVLPFRGSEIMPTEAESAARYVDAAVGALGVFAADEIAYGRKDAVGGIRAELEARLEAGRLRAFVLPGEKPLVRYATEEAIGLAASRDGTAAGKGRCFVLSPFDPFLIDRTRISRLFGFGYTIECYIPEARRRFGYFSLPVLATGGFAEGGGLDGRSMADGRFVALVDAKADRKRSVLEVRRLALGDGVFCAPVRSRGLADLAREVGRAIAEFARFNGAAQIEYARVDAPTAAAARILAEASEAE